MDEKDVLKNFMEKQISGKSDDAAQGSEADIAEKQKEEPAKQPMPTASSEQIKAAAFLRKALNIIVIAPLVIAAITIAGVVAVKFIPIILTVIKEIFMILAFGRII